MNWFPQPMLDQHSPTPPSTRWPLPILLLSLGQFQLVFDACVKFCCLLLTSHGASWYCASTFDVLPYRPSVITDQRSMSTTNFQRLEPYRLPPTFLHAFFRYSIQLSPVSPPLFVHPLSLFRTPPPVLHHGDWSRDPMQLM